MLFSFPYFLYLIQLFDPTRYTKYTITSLEKLWKPKIFVEPDLGIPLDLLDLSVYKYDLSKMLYCVLIARAHLLGYLLL